MGKKVCFGPSALLPNTAVDCDADVLRAVASDNVIHVPENSPVASWLRTLASVRGWEVEDIQSTRSWLSNRYPRLAPVVAALVSDSETEVPDSLWVWAEGKLGIPHSSKPSAQHAETVARWRLGQSHSPEEAILLECALDEFADDASREIYAIAARSSQDDIVEHLVGIRNPVLTSEFLASEEPWTANAIEAWTLRRLSEASAQSLRGSLTSRAAFSAKEEVAKVYAVAVDNGLQADPTIVDLSRPLLDEKHLRKLIEACPPAPPSLVPDDFSELGRWFETSYLPYRRWMHARQIPSDDIVAPIWKDFAKVYLAAIREGLGSGKGPLAVHRVRAIDSESESVLLLILDGPLPDDTSELVKRFRRNNSQWSVVNSEWVLAAVPTVTEVCRPSMTAGVAAAHCEDYGDAVTSLAKAKALLDANARLVVVKLLQPDREYETLNVSDTTLRRRARSQLEMIADELSDICDKSQIDRIILCADHGRCMSRVEPIIDRVSEGKVHRRAILQVPRTSCDVPPGSIRLNGELYGFDSQYDAIVAQGATTFKGAPEVWYPHGGLLPEEGFVHWLELRRAPMPPEVSGHVKLHGVEGQSGQLHISVANHSKVALQLVHVSWSTDNETIVIDTNSKFVPPATTLPVIQEVPRLLARVPEEVTLELRAPDGQVVSVLVPVKVHVRRMQSQNIDLLDDL